MLYEYNVSRQDGNVLCACIKFSGLLYLICPLLSALDTFPAYRPSENMSGPASLSAVDMLGYVVRVKKDGDTIIGSGGFAKVWKGRIEDGKGSMCVAVKEIMRFSDLSAQSNQRVLKVIITHASG